MKVESPNLTIERSSNFEQKSFSIKNSALAFQILSSGLYSRKIEAIIRELSANAKDAHVLAGVANKPFLVKLPNSMEPEFYIRDFGYGLTKEEVETLYTTYFESTKTDSNDYAGFMGIGSKVSWCYTDSYSVTSYKDGVEYVYCMFLNEDGIPSVSLISELETQEPNGLKVQLSVKHSDFKLFKEDARKVYQNFEVRPEIVGAEIKFFEPTLTTPNITIYDSTADYERKTHIVMGGIQYDLNLLELKISTPTINAVLQNYRDICIKCQIGDVDVTASRESCAYTPKSLEKLRKIVAAAENELREALEKDLQTQPSWWAASVFANKSGNYAHLMNVLKYKGKVLQTYVNIGAYTSSCHDYQPTSYGSKKWHSSYNLYMQNDFLLIENDLDVGARQRVENLVQNGGESRSCVLLKFKDDQHKQEFLDKYEFPPADLILASSLDKVKKNKAAGTGVIKRFILYEFQLSTYKPSWQRHKAAPLPPSGYYLELPAKSSDAQKASTLKYLNPYLKQVLGINLDTVKVYGLRTSYYNKLVKQQQENLANGGQPSQFEEFYSAIRKLLETELQNAKYKDVSYLFTDDYTTYSYFFDFVSKLKHGLPSAHKLLEYHGKYTEVKSNQDKLNSLKHLFAQFSISDKWLVNKSYWKSAIDEFQAKYPLLDIVASLDSSQYSNQKLKKVDEIIQYIKSQDRLLRQKKKRRSSNSSSLSVAA